MANQFLAPLVAGGALNSMTHEQLTQVENAAEDAATGLLLSLSLIGRLCNHTQDNRSYEAEEAKEDLAEIALVLMTLPRLLVEVNEIKDAAAYLLNSSVKPKGASHA